uniref:GAF domain-containing protein n=1 Tax=candidate division WOR-3 bacterium TaxID=2052148 RepID=A0A7C4YHF4_UNCW3
MREYKKIIEDVKRILKEEIKKEEKLLKICKSISNLDGYDWVGFYIVNKEDEEELLLGPYVGAPTEHIKIKKGKGICGQALQIGKTFLVRDVSKETNYLSCSPDVQSEIVVPIYKGKKIVGEIDIDSHKINNFKKEDKEFLEEIAKLVSNEF